MHLAGSASLAPRLTITFILGATLLVACGKSDPGGPGPTAGAGGKPSGAGGSGGAPPAGGQGGSAAGGTTGSGGVGPGGSGGGGEPVGGATGGSPGSGGGPAVDGPGPGPEPDPGGSETYAATALSPGKGQRTDRRPIPVGFYDATANKTFVSWMGPGSDAIVKAFDHVSKTWSADKIAGNATFADKHNYPALIKGKDNRLYMFYGCHNTPLRMAVSPGPLSIDGAWTDGNIGAAPDASYPAPIITSEGTMYVFIRLTRQQNGHSDDRPFALIKSTDSGKTWTKQMVIDPYPRPDNLTEIYNGKITYQPAQGAQKARIHLAWTLAGGGPGSHQHDAFTRNVYYAYLDPTNDHLYDIKGTDLGTSIDNNEGETKCKALDTGCSNCDHQAGYQVSVNYNDDATPVILFTHSGKGLTTVRWDGNAWTSNLVTSMAGEPRDIFKFGARSFQAFRTAGNTCQVFRTTDGGATWRQEATVTAPHAVGRCHVIENHHPDVKLFMEQSPAEGAGDTSTAKVTAGHVPPYGGPASTP
jgi:hypothetical protein